MDKTIEIVLLVFIFLALIGTIGTQVITSVSGLNNSGTNVSGGSRVLLALTTLIIVIGFVLFLWKKNK